MADFQINSSNQINDNEKQTNGHTVFSLENILSDNHDSIEHPTVPSDVMTVSTGGWDEEDIDRPPVEGYCIECEGVYSTSHHPRQS